MNGKQSQDQRLQELMKTMNTPLDEYKGEFCRRMESSVPRISTGYLELDQILCGGFTNELYILGAQTGTGKSAFMLSMAQNIASKGVKVFYFTLEMGMDELIARGVADQSYMQHLQDPGHAELVTTSDILSHTYDPVIEDFTRIPYSAYEKYTEQYFCQLGGNLHFIEAGVGGLTAKLIANACANYKKSLAPSEQMVVFIDYLQLLRAEPNDRSQSDRKTKTDTSVSILKALASQIGMPVITASSVSRGVYGSRVGTSSYKESGDVEYTGGVLFGWNWNGITDCNISEDEILRAKEQCLRQGYRNVQLDILKARNTASGKTVRFKYYPAYNHFTVRQDIPPQNTAAIGSEDVVMKF